MTASDARPPSASVASVSLGWHTHGENSAWLDGERDCETVAGPSRPVLVVDPAEARETIARALAEHTTYGFNGSEILCACGKARWVSTAGFVDHQRDAVLAALGGQEQP